RVSPEIFPSKVGDIRLEAEKTLQEWLKKIHIPGVTPITILVSPDLSLRGAVRTLLAYAEQSGADLIAVSAMARKGISHFLLGSFAETLIFESEIPIFLVSPKMVLPKKFETILFPTDLSPSSKKVLGIVCETARNQNAKIVLFHQ